MKHNPLSRATDPATSHIAEDDYKASGAQESQAEAILARLRRGPAGAGELAQLALKYTSRISDLRTEGHVILYAPGSRLYTLITVPTQMEMDL